MPLFSRLKALIESDRTSIDLSKYDINDNVLRPELIDYNIYDLYKSIPLDPQRFYEDMGCPILHPNTGQQIKGLADYQIEFWKSALPKPVGLGYNYSCCIKSNKIGLTTSELYGDFQSLIKIAPGRQVLVVAQTQEMANDHLYTLKRDILSSEKYSKFLITKSIEGLSKEEQSKVRTLYIRNPLNRFKPGRIIAIGPQESSSVSWKEVYRIHVSDITKARTDYDKTIAGLFSRLANTRGVLKIECVPAMPQGFIYDIAQHPPTNFFFRYYNYECGVRSGIMSQEFIEEQRSALRSLFENIYNCQFGSSEDGNVFDYDKIEECIVPDSDIVLDPMSLKVMGIDPGFGSSNFAIVVAQYSNLRKKIEIVYAEEHERPIMEDMINRIWTIKEQCWHLSRIYVDAANPEVWSSIKKHIAREQHDEKLVQQIIAECKQIGQDPAKRMIVVPSGFGQSGGVKMLQHAKSLVEDSRQIVKIPQRFQSLYLALRTAWAQDYKLDKEKTAYDDTLDAFRLAMQFFQLENK